MTAEQFLEQAGASGVRVRTVDDRVIWDGPASGTVKPQGPLAGRRVALVVAAEFSDFQMYHLVEYLSELGATVELVGVEGPVWKNTRHTDARKGVQGLWGLSIDPIPVLGTARSVYRSLERATGEPYDAAIVLGGHSADILMNETGVHDLLRRTAESGGVLGAIGEGMLPLISAGLVQGRACTGNNVVSYLLERVGSFRDEPVVRDNGLVTARDTVDTPLLVREIARSFDPNFTDPREGILAGKRLVIVSGEDFEDIELVAPVLELLYRGAEITLATFPAPLRSRPPLLGLDMVMGNFGVSVPLQEIPRKRYEIAPLPEIDPGQPDVVMIPGAFCPWNMVRAATPVEWLRKADAAGTTIAAICHGAIPLSAAGLVEGKVLAGVGQCRSHVDVMGGSYRGDYSAVVDGRIVSGRVPPDVPEFLDAITYRALVG